MMPHPQIRTVTRNRTRTRRLSACQRHPSEPVTGFCALCLRDRLAGLDSSSGQVEVEKSVVSSRRTRGHGVALSSAPAPVPELRRSKSVAAEKCEVLNGLVTDLRRESCDVRARSTLSYLFVGDDTKRGGDRDCVGRVGSMNLGLSSFAEPVLETNEDEGEDDDDEIRVLNNDFVRNEIDDHGDEIRVSNDVYVRNEVDDDCEIEEEGDLKTMKEFIDIELQNKRKNFWEAASVFSQKLRKWRQKQKEKKQSRGFINGGTDSKLGQAGQFRDTQSEVADYGFGRRSCDTEPRFSIDAHRMSVEDPRFSFDEHRASWDGYMTARTIPRLTPMLSIVDNMMLAPVNKVTTTHPTMENLQMHSISEDGASSGGSNQSNSDSSTSNRGSSSISTKSSSTKTVGSGGDDVKSASNARVSPANDVIFQGTKLVITEKELQDWHLNNVKNNSIESVSNASISTSKTTVNPSNVHQKTISSRWKKVCNLWGQKHKLNDKKNVEDNPKNRAEKVTSSSVISRNRRDEFVLDRNRSTRYSTSDLDSGLLRLYLTPFRNSRRGKSVKSRGRNLSPLMATNGLQMN